MLIVPPSNPNDRHRRFRERHPGYHARTQARKRDAAKRDAAIIEARVRAEFAAQPAPAASDQLLLPFATDGNP